MDRRAWRATVHRVTKSQMSLKPLSMHAWVLTSMRRQNDRTLKEELPRSVGAQYATGDQWRNNSRKNEEMETKQQHPAVDGTGDRSKV